MRTDRVVMASLWFPSYLYFYSPHHFWVTLPFQDLAKKKVISRNKVFLFLVGGCLFVFCLCFWDLVSGYSKKLGLALSSMENFKVFVCLFVCFSLCSEPLMNISLSLDSCVATAHSCLSCNCVAVASPTLTLSAPHTDCIPKEYVLLFQSLDSHIILMWVMGSGKVS